MDLKGKIAFVTGAASGLGRATCLELASRGAFVGAADLNQQAAADVAGAIGDAAVAFPVDVADDAAVRAGLEHLAERFGGVHVAVNCAGIPDAVLLAPRDGVTQLEAYRRVIDVNLVGTFHVMTHAAALMLRNDPDHNGERGVLVNTASVAAWQGQKGQAAYSASKAGVIGMMLPAAREFAGRGIRVVTIAPGIFDTGMAASLPKVRDELVAMNLEPKRLGDPAEFAALAAHIVENTYLNATTLNIDAGIRLSK